MLAPPPRLTPRCAHVHGLWPSGPSSSCSMPGKASPQSPIASPIPALPTALTSGRASPQPDRPSSAHTQPAHSSHTLNISPRPDRQETSGLLPHMMMPPPVLALLVMMFGLGDAMQCAGNFGAVVNDPVCCGQPGVVSALWQVCPSDAPFCGGFVQGSTWGTCSSTCTPRVLDGFCESQGAQSADKFSQGCLNTIKRSHGTPHSRLHR